MRKKRTEQELRTLLKQYQTSGLTQRAFCEQQSISLSTFLAKRQQYSQVCADDFPGFIQAQVTQTTQLEVMAETPSEMTLLVNGRKLRLPSGTPASYVAELIGALS
ncbi:TPA: IS66 family insertion sequence element accessory protein TnpA [Vibrio parahaemolyticus]